VLKVTFAMDPEVDGELGPRAEDVAQEAIDATATAYTDNAEIDVDEQLRIQLSSRGIRAVNEEWLSETAREIRSGHHTRVADQDAGPAGP
jgi:hypothetical protein